MTATKTKTKSKTKKIQPTADHLLVEPASEEERTSSGIYLPDTAKEKPQTGKVLAVGTDEEVQKNFHEGDTVLYTKYGGTNFKWNGEEYLIVQASDVLAVLKD